MTKASSHKEQETKWTVRTGKKPNPELMKIAAAEIIVSNMKRLERELAEKQDHEQEK